MNTDIIKSWKCWCVDKNENITEYSSVTHTLADVPTVGMQAMRLWFNREDSSRFISGNKYYIIYNDDIINQLSTSVLQIDSIEDINNFSLIRESIDVSDATDNNIFNLMIEATDPTL